MSKRRRLDGAERQPDLDGFAVTEEVEGLPLDDEAVEKAEAEARIAAASVSVIRDVEDRFVFRFEVGPAILAQVYAKLDRLPRLPLGAVAAERSKKLEDAHRQFPGVSEYRAFYQLFFKGESKYVGKTTRGVAVRLFEHQRKLFGRVGINLDDVECKYVFVEDPSLVDMAEGSLISYFGGMASWNASGLGSKVTGAGRLDQKQSEWQRTYPPDFSVTVEAGGDEPMTLFALLKQLAVWAPVTLAIPKVQRSAFQADHPTAFDIRRVELLWVDWVKLLESHLAEGWAIERGTENWHVRQRK